jgi:hypothetical protein
MVVFTLDSHPFGHLMPRATAGSRIKAPARTPGTKTLATAIIPNMGLQEAAEVQGRMCRIDIRQKPEEEDSQETLEV